MAGRQSLAHLMPRGVDIYAACDRRPYPFPTMFDALPEACIPQLLGCLPQRNELFEYLESFQKRVHVCSFPHIPLQITKSEVERFLADDRKNAETFPDMLALLFAALALGSQHSVYDRCNKKWVPGAMEKQLKQADIYS